MVGVSAYTRQSRTYEPRDPELRGKRIKRFRLDELQRVSREYRDIHRALHRLLPDLVYDSGFVPQVRQLITKYTEMDIDLWLDAVRVVKRSHLRGLIPKHACLVVIGLAPLEEKVLVEIDLAFAYRVIDRLLGGHGIAVDIHRPLTEIEQGVFSFFLLKVLKLFQGHLVFPEQVSLRLEDMRSDLRSTADILRVDPFWLCSSWKMNYDLDVSYVRFLVPTALARRVVDVQPPTDSTIAERVRERIRARMNRLAGVVVDAPIAVGRIELLPSDLDALDPGDIVLLDECTLEQIGPEGESGNATMTVGLGQQGVVHGVVGPDEAGRMVFQVTHIETHPAPASHDPHEVHGEPKHPEEAMAEYEEPQEYYDEQNDDGRASWDDVHDEDYGIDDEDEGDDEQYYEEQGEYDQQGYEQGEYEQYDEQGYAEDIPVDDGDNLVEAEPLLGDIPVNVVVELGRVQLTADEIIRLRAGHLMELGRSPADPVDLVVAGKLLAKGELVEIEGTLGVKILSLVKEEGT